MEPDNKIFRQALIDRLASPEQLDSLMQVTDPLGWLALLGCAGLLVTANPVAGLISDAELHPPSDTKTGTECPDPNCE